MIKDLLDIGPNVIERTRGTRKTTYRLYISSKKDLANLVQFIDNMNSLSGYKLQQYKEWKDKFSL